MPLLEVIKDYFLLKTGSIVNQQTADALVILLLFSLKYKNFNMRILSHTDEKKGLICGGSCTKSTTQRCYLRWTQYNW